VRDRRGQARAAFLHPLAVSPTLPQIVIGRSDPGEEGARDRVPLQWRPKAAVADVARASCPWSGMAGTAMAQFWGRFANRLCAIMRARARGCGIGAGKPALHPSPPQCPRHSPASLSAEATRVGRGTRSRARRCTADSAVPGHRQECLCYVAGRLPYVPGGPRGVFVRRAGPYDARRGTGSLPRFIGVPPVWGEGAFGQRWSANRPCLPWSAFPGLAFGPRTLRA
jgi:hypothetical protein